MIESGLSENEELILREIKTNTENASEMLDLFECSRSESEFELAAEKARGLLGKFSSSRLLVLLILASGLQKASDGPQKSSVAGNLQRRKDYPVELVALSELIRTGNVVKECCEHEGPSALHGSGNSFAELALNNLIKLPALALNFVLSQKRNQERGSNIRLLDELVPQELHDRSYYCFVWVLTLDYLRQKGSEEGESSKTRLLRMLFKRLFARGYRDLLCSIIADSSPARELLRAEDRSLLDYSEPGLKFVFQSIVQLNSGDLQLTQSFIRQLLLEIERSRLREDRGGGIYLVPRAPGSGEDELSKDPALSLLSIITEFCVTNDDFKSKFLLEELFVAWRRRLSTNALLVFLDFSVLNILVQEEAEKMRSPGPRFDYIESSRRGERPALQERREDSVCKHLGFFEELILSLAKQWNTFREAMTYSLGLATLIIRAISIFVYLSDKQDLKLKEILLSPYSDITNGIQFRLGSIDPIIRSCAIFLGEFYLNLLYELFPSDKERSANYPAGGDPKFEELGALAKEVRDELGPIFNSSKAVLVGDRLDASEPTYFETTGQAQEPAPESKEDEKDVQEELSVTTVEDEDDEFWEKAPAICQPPEEGATSAVGNSLCKRSHDASGKDGSRKKSVNRAFELINFYTNEKDSKDIPDKDERLLEVLSGLVEDVERDDSDFGYLVLPLVNKLLTLKEKEQRLHTLVIISKLIQLDPLQTALSLIAYACDVNNGVSMDIRILVFNSLILGCRGLSNSAIASSGPVAGPKKSVFANLFDRHSLAWSSSLARSISALIRQSQDPNFSEKIPNIFFVTSLELFNQIILSTSHSNINTPQIAHFGLDLVLSVDVHESPLFKDTSVRRSVYLLAFNLVQKLASPHAASGLAGGPVSQIHAWLAKVQALESDPDCIRVIRQLRSCTVA
ncbi:hypothetical protein HWI79_3688 [Cryptosporidium felis]|nr:hypothetical protein HWI79_3688 [Cryptosporidium felis]